jgi:hypothetical protein
MPRKRPNKPPTYFTTIRPDSRDDAAYLDGVREVIQKINSGLRRSAPRYSIALSPRKGKLTTHDWKYQNRFSKGKRIRIEDAERVDVYLTRRPTNK